MEKKRFIDRLFPVKYDFYDMLTNQAQMNTFCVEALFEWLTSQADTHSQAILQSIKDADAIRMDMEKKLVESFSTPFDRGDIYTISVGMDKIIEYAKSTLLSMQEFEVSANETIIAMVGRLKEGTELFSQSIKSLKHNPDQAGQSISKMRGTHIAIEQLYRDGMAKVFKSNDPMLAIKQKEVYHHLKDASENLENAVDILHRIVVRLT